MTTTKSCEKCLYNRLCVSKVPCGEFESRDDYVKFTWSPSQEAYIVFASQVHKVTIHFVCYMLDEYGAREVVYYDFYGQTITYDKTNRDKCNPLHRTRADAERALAAMEAKMCDEGKRT